MRISNKGHVLPNVFAYKILEEIRALSCPIGARRRAVGNGAELPRIEKHAKSFLHLILDL